MKKNQKKIKDPKIGIVGGQAVLEGVMMKSGDRCSLAVRTPEKEIVLDNSTFVSLRKKHKVCNLPIVRGCVSMVEQLSLSMNMLTKSAEMQGIDLDEPETRFEAWLSEKLGDNLMKIITAIGMVLGLALGIGLFLMLPTFAAKGVDYLTGGFVGQFPILRSAIEGIIRMIVFVGYIWAVSLMPDIRRTYEYHGAEHKSVDCFEKGLELTPENARKCTRFHPRCGTSFIFVMLIISIVLNSLLSWDNVWIRFGSKILMLPLIVGLGFEFIRYAGAHDNIFTRIVSAPGLWMQRITTREPDDSQLEIALAALKNAIPEEFGGIVQDSGRIEDGTIGGKTVPVEDKKAEDKSAEDTSSEDTSSEDASSK